MRSLRSFTLVLPEPWSVNVWIRKSHRDRNQKRNTLAEQIRAALPPGWRPLQRFTLDAHLWLTALRDPLELGFCFKTEMDACIEAGLIADDGPRNLVSHSIAQEVARGRPGARLHFVEAPRSIDRKRTQLAKPFVRPRPVA